MKRMRLYCVCKHNCPRDEESQFNEVMSLAVRSPLEVLEHQLEPYLHGSLNNPSNDML